MKAAVILRGGDFANWCIEIEIWEIGMKGGWLLWD
jgi:hypothetical protein